MHRRFDNFIRTLLQTASTVHVWSHKWELKQITFEGGTRVLRILAVFREYMLRELEISAGSTLLVLLSTPTISDVCTAGTAWFRMFVLRVLLEVLDVLYYSSYSKYSQYLGFQYSHCSYSQHAQYLGHHLREHCNTLSTSSIQSIDPRNTASTGSFRKKYRTPYIRTCTMQ